MSDIMTDEEQILWFLQEFENAEDYQLEDCELEIYGEDEQGREGTCTISVHAVCQKASGIVKRLLAERDALTARVIKLESLRDSDEARLELVTDIVNAVLRKNVNAAPIEVIASIGDILDADRSKCLAEIKAEAGRDGFIEGYEQCHYDIDNDYISRSEPMADQYADKIRNAGTWLKDSNVNGGKRGGEK